MAAVPTNKSAEPGSIMVRIDRNDRAALLAESPGLYYAPDHYLDYDAVLVRLARLTPDLLRDLLAMAHKFATRKPSRPQTPSLNLNSSHPSPNYAAPSIKGTPPTPRKRVAILCGLPV